MATGTDGALTRALEFERRSVALVADELTSIPEGWVARSWSLPLVWSLNCVGVTGPTEVKDALALVDRYLADLPYRQLLAQEPGGQRMAPELRAAGWRIDTDLLMALSRDPDRELDTSAVIEAPEPDALELMREWTGEDEVLRRDPEAHEQVLESSRLTWRSRDTRRLGVQGPDGTLAGITMLYSDGVVAQVEDVYVVPRERGRGLGRALVTRAARLAVDEGHELVFIIADDDGWPKQLYRRIGFEPLGRTWAFNRTAG